MMRSWRRISAAAEITPIRLHGREPADCEISEMSDVPIQRVAADVHSTLGKSAPETIHLPDVAKLVRGGKKD